MIAELPPGAWDDGRPVSHFKKVLRFRPTFPMAAYLTQPLSLQCQSFESMQAFLKTCRYVPDDEQFDRDYWMPPEDFEKRRKGDCDCAAIWAWRQLLDMGYEARFVLGSVGLSDRGHAWVTFRQNGTWHLLEPWAARAGMRLPRLIALGYRPRMSVGWDGEQPRFYEHRDAGYKPGTQEMLGMIAEATAFRNRMFVLVWRARAQLFWQRLRDRRSVPVPEPQRAQAPPYLRLLRAASIADLHATVVERPEGN